MIGVWNISGLSKPEKQNAIKNFVARNKLNIVVVLETG